MSADTTRTEYEAARLEHELKMIDAKRLLPIDETDFVETFGRTSYDELVDEVDWYGIVHESFLDLSEYFICKFKELDGG